MHKKLLIAQFCIFLIVMLPVCFADEFEQTAENIIIEAKKYEPDVLRTDLLEQLEIPVFVTLGSVRGAPISVPKIRHVSVDIVKQKQAQKENATVEGTSEDVMSKYIFGTPIFYSSSTPTLDNLGYLKVTLRKIPKESQVPKQIDIDLKATIDYEAEVAGFTIGGENTFQLEQETEEQTREFKHDRGILGERAYLRVSMINGKYATIQVYDSDFKRITSATLKEGDTSGMILISRTEDVQPEHIRLKVEEVTNAGKIKLNFKGAAEPKTYDLRENIQNSEWKVVYYKEDTDTKKSYITLGNPSFKSWIVLTGEDAYNSVASLKKIAEGCAGQEKCKAYTSSGIDRQDLKDLELPTQDFSNALNSLESIGLESFAGIRGKTERNAIFQTLTGEGPYNIGQGIGKKECGCKVSSINPDSVSVSGVRTNTACRTSQDRDVVAFKTGDSQSICNDAITLKGITTDQKATITVLPGIGRGLTTSYFSIHIPVEKRIIQYTPEELQQKINSTQALIKKLDNVIDNLQKIVEGWTKVCLATAAVFTIMSFFQGMSAKKPETKPSAGETTTKEGEKLQEGVFKVMDPPPGVSFSDLEIYNSQSSIGTIISGGKYAPMNEETYYFHTKELSMYSAKKNPVAYVGTKFRNTKTQEWYRLNADGTFSKEGKTSQGNYDFGDNSPRYAVSSSPDGNEISVGIQSCTQLPGTYTTECNVAVERYGSALTLLYSKQQALMEVWWNGLDGKFYRQGKAEKNDDQLAFEIPAGPEFETLKKRLLQMQDSSTRGEKSYSWGFNKYNLGGGLKSSKSADIACKEVMSEGQCKILFNACDPVMCPPSRCDFDHRYRVDNVIQSGLLGSLILCLPNIKEGVVMPVCLSGILAALKNIRSILQGYVDCLQTALQDGKSVGICDRIRSIFICEIVWREAMTLLGLAKGNLFDAVVGGGGSEYLGNIKGGVDEAKKTVDFFTRDYASSVFAAYRARSSRELGTVICEQAMYGKIPIVGDIVDEVSKAQNPPQFTAYIEEQPYSEINRYQSAYKLYYHIYAGSQQTVNYKVYMRKSGRIYTCNECSGAIKQGEFVDKSTAFFYESGYNEICVDINQKPYCNFGRVVSTSFAISAANNYIIQKELSNKIQDEEQCRADVRGYTPDIQVQKVCSTLNPGIGKGTDEEKMWTKVGTCGTKSGAFLGDCWMRLGDLAVKNPEAYSSGMSGLCESDGGKICEAGQTCKGRETITPVQASKEVRCCYGTCETDATYNNLKDELRAEPFVKDAYNDMYIEGVRICEDKQISSNDPFIHPPVSWSNKPEGEKNSQEYNQFHYFKGMIYLICRNWGKAREEFSLLTDKEKAGGYYKKACGDNKQDNGGNMYKVFKMLCVEAKGATKAVTTPEGTNKTEEVKPSLQLTKLVLKTPSDKEKEIAIKGDTKEIKLDIGGTYKVEKLEFNQPVKKCSFYFGTQQPDVLPTTETETTTCTFTTNNEFSTINVPAEQSYLYVLGISRDAEGVTYANTFDVTLGRSAKANEMLLCKADVTIDSTSVTYAFCLNQPGLRCSDYHYRDTFFSLVTDPKEYYTDIGACKEQCVKIVKPDKNYCKAFNELEGSGISLVK